MTVSALDRPVTVLMIVALAGGLHYDAPNPLSAGPDPVVTASLIATVTTIGDDAKVPPPNEPTGTSETTAEASMTSEASVTTMLDNEFIPENVNISDCVSAVPRPGCGSEERGGWHQTLVLVALVAGLGVIGWRIVAAMRRRA